MKLSSVINVLSLVPLLAGLTLVSARPEYRERIPNGRLGNDTEVGFGCDAIGHEECVPGATRNQFGLDFYAAGEKWTKDLCGMDSDGDGATNGHELGDPCCQWSEGDEPLRSTGLSHPGDATDTTSEEFPDCPEFSDDGDDDEDVCFSGTSTVILADGSTKIMHAF